MDPKLLGVLIFVVLFITLVVVLTTVPIKKKGELPKPGGNPR